MKITKFEKIEDGYYSTKIRGLLRHYNRDFQAHFGTFERQGNITFYTVAADSQSQANDFLCDDLTMLQGEVAVPCRHHKEDKCVEEAKSLTLDFLRA